MSRTEISFLATLAIGEESIPLVSEVAFGDSESQDGVKNGFLFKLDRQPEDPPVTVYLGDVIDFVETKLGAGSLAESPDMSLISEAFPSLTQDNFNASNQTLINVYEFTINSTTDEFVFSFNLDVESSDPTTGLIALPSELSQWVKIEAISISFLAKKSSTPSTPETRG